MHLACSAMMHGKTNLVMDWAVDVFRWLTRRNEVILSTRLLYQQLSDSKSRGQAEKKRSRVGGKSKQNRVQLPEEGDSISSSKNLLPVMEHKAVMSRPASVRKAERVSANWYRFLSALKLSPFLSSVNSILPFPLSHALSSLPLLSASLSLFFIPVTGGDESSDHQR